VQKSLFFQNSFRSYLIPILLLICSFLIYSFNLEGQPSYYDESFYFAWGGVYFDLLKKGDFNNPCFIGLKDCELLFSDTRTTETGETVYWLEISYTPVRNFFVGFGQYLTTGENKGQFYVWSCFECIPDLELEPSREEYSSGRFFSAVFGSLAVVLAFFIGKILFNRITGLFFSLILLFSSLWLVHSRLIMSEVYLYFFILLSILLLLQSFKKENNHRVLFFIFGAISFGIAVNIKLIAIELAIPILIMILFYNSFNEKLNFRFFKNKKNILKVSSLVLVFFVISSITFVATYPRYYDDTLNEVLKNQLFFEVSPTKHFQSLPTVEKNYLYNTLATLQVILLPYLMDSYIHDVFPDEVQKGGRDLDLAKEAPSNYSTIPLSLFFFIGLISIIRKIKNRNLKFSEFVLLVWFASLFIFNVLVVDFAWIERYYIPLMFPVILIASYALAEFIKQIQNQKEKILFFMLFIIAHSLYIISFFDEIYFSNTGLWGSPIPVASEHSLIDPLVYLSSMMFVGISFLIYLRVKIRITTETS